MRILFGLILFCVNYAHAAAHELASDTPAEKLTKCMAYLEAEPGLDRDVFVVQIQNTIRPGKLDKTAVVLLTHESIMGGTVVLYPVNASRLRTMNRTVKGSIEAEADRILTLELRDLEFASFLKSSQVIGMAQVRFDDGGVKRIARSYAEEYVAPGTMLKLDGVYYAVIGADGGAMFPDLSERTIHSLKVVEFGGKPSVGMEVEKNVQTVTVHSEDGHYELGGRPVRSAIFVGNAVFDIRQKIGAELKSPTAYVKIESWSDQSAGQDYMEVDRVFITEFRELKEQASLWDSLPSD